MTSFTCLYAVVTSRICVWTRWWTIVSAIFYSFLSVLVYILYVIFSNYWEHSLVRYSIGPLVASPLFWLTILLIGGCSFSVDILVEYLRLQYAPNASDYLRKLIKEKEGIEPKPITEYDLEKFQRFI